jgi:hypothetical protein
MNVTVGLMAGFGTSTTPAQTIGTDLSDTGANFDDLLAGDGALAGADLAKVRQYAADGPQSSGGGCQDAYINGNADQHSQDDLDEALGSDITGLRQAITTLEGDLQQLATAGLPQPSGEAAALAAPGPCGRAAARGSSQGWRRVAHCQDAINERAVTIDGGGCAPPRSEHSVIATFGMTFLFLR